MDDKHKISLYDIISRDSFGLTVISFLAYNRALYAYMKMVHTDLVYRDIRPEYHWLESLLPMEWWIFLWCFIGTVSLISIRFKALRPVTVGFTVGLLMIWGGSAAMSPQITSPLTGVLWLAVSLLLMWGTSRYSPGHEKEHLEKLHHYMNNE